MEIFLEKRLETSHPEATYIKIIINYILIIIFITNYITLHGVGPFKPWIIIGILFSGFSVQMSESKCIKSAGQKRTPLRVSEETRTFTKIFFFLQKNSRFRRKNKEKFLQYKFFFVFTRFPARLGKGFVFVLHFSITFRSLIYTNFLQTISIAYFCSSLVIYFSDW